MELGRSFDELGNPVALIKVLGGTVSVAPDLLPVDFTVVIKVPRG